MKNLYKALSDFQNECPIIFKGSKGYGYNYADLTAIITIINPILKKYSLTYSQILEGSSLKTIVCHFESGETIDGKMDIPQGVNLKGMNDFQVLGSAITYLRRYALASMLGLITDADLGACGQKEEPKIVNANVVLSKPLEIKKTDPALLDRVTKALSNINTKTEFEIYAANPDYQDAKKDPELSKLLTAKWNKIK